MANSSSPILEAKKSTSSSTQEAGQPAVTVHSFEEAPDYLTEALTKATELFKQHKKLSKVKRKTIGAMQVTFSEGNPATIIAISGFGSNEWKTCTPGDTVSLGEEIKKGFEDNQMYLAPRTSDRTEIQLIEGDEIPLEGRGSFMEVLEQRMKEKQSRLRDALGKLSVCEEDKKKIICDVLKTSAEYSPTRPERDFEDVVNFYFGMLCDDKFLPKLGLALKLLLSNDPQKECMEQLERTDYDRLCQVKSQLKRVKSLLEGDESLPKVKNLLEKVENLLEFDSLHESVKVLHKRVENLLTGLNVQSFADECCNQVPECDLGCYAIAFGFKEYKPTEMLANLSVQCAEDNAISCLCEIKKSRIIAKIEWVSVTLMITEEGTFEFKNKPLCAVCAVGFIPRAKQINNLPN